MGTGATTDKLSAADSVSMMPGSGRIGSSTTHTIAPGGNGGFHMPTRSFRNNPSGWIIGAAILAVASTYWYMGVGRARTEASVIRAWASSDPVKSAVRSAIQTSGMQRKKAIATRKKAALAAYNSAAQKFGAKDLASNPVPLALSQLFENKLLKAPAQTGAALTNAALKVEAAAFPLHPKAVSDTTFYTNTGWCLLTGTAACALLGALGIMPKRRASFPMSISVADPTSSLSPATAPRIMPPMAAPSTIPVAAASTPFPPIPDTVPTLNPPARGSIAAGVAAVASSSSEVTRLVKRLEELESLSERLKGERDETRKELSWTQVALDDFRKRVADATTMAAASAAQSAGASEQRAAQAEQRVTEAVEHINEALQRAVETEHGVSRAKEMAQTAEERAAHAETRSQEIQFQLSRAMERLSDLEQLAATTRLGGGHGGAIPISNMMPPAPTPSSAHNGYRNGHLTSIPSPIDDMLAAAAKPTAKSFADRSPSRSAETGEEVYRNATSEPEEPLAPSGGAARGQRVPSPRITNTKMSDLEAGLKLARSIRSRTQKAAAKATGEE